MKQFKAPKKSLGGLGPEATARLIAAVADVALIVDRDGVVQDFIFDSNAVALKGHETWRGRPWREIVTGDSRSKVDALLSEAASGAVSKWRQVNHASTSGANIPVLYSAIRIDSDGRFVAVGRDLRTVAALQQRLLEAQQSMERDYSRVRHVETRYRLLFQMSLDAILVVEVASRRIVEANPAAGRLLGEPAARLVGRLFPEGFDPESMRLIEGLLTRLQATGRADDVRVRHVDARGELLASALLFRQENASLLLIRLSPVQPDASATALPSAESKIIQVVEQSTDAFVVTDTSGEVLATNAAFLELAQLAAEEQARGEPLERWLGRSAVDLNVLIGNLRQKGSVRLYATVLRGEQGASADVEISAVSVMDGGQPYFGFTIRDVGRRLTGQPRLGREPASSVLPRSVEQLTELVGRVSLRELVRESTDVIERLCIEAALELTRDNRASAAELLGLSRQSLYVKLRRYGLGDVGDKPE